MTEQRVVTVAEAAVILACSEDTVRRMIRAGTLRALRRRGGRSYILYEADVRACVEEVRPEAGGLRPAAESSRSHREAVEYLRSQGIG